MLRASCTRYVLRFRFPAGTSRGVLTEKEAWFIKVWETENPGVTGYGECGVIPGLSPEAGPDYAQVIHEVCHNIESFRDDFPDWLTLSPSIRFGLETALKDLEEGGRKILFPSAFSAGQSGIPINGLVWMGDIDAMFRQVREKIDMGFRCIKMKIGATDTEEELGLMKRIRQEFPAGDIEIRVDANGALSPDRAPVILERLAGLKIHSIEQPLKAGLWEETARLCRNAPIPVALDEELIGVHHHAEKRKLLETIRPYFIILKPSLLGGFATCHEWIDLARTNGTGWWVTSALESNIGLNAIAQWAFTLGNPLPQGLGTGQLYLNNIPSPLEVSKGYLYYRPYISWNTELIGL
ncbi:MAG: o-succinylbenzoate synthase [Bacteroidales bacterium]|nr:o-succinylbenzoate synthase [Bacteroidales bacterium]